MGWYNCALTMHVQKEAIDLDRLRNNLEEVKKNFKSSYPNGGYHLYAYVDMHADEDSDSVNTITVKFDGSVRDEEEFNEYDMVSAVIYSLKSGYSRENMLIEKSPHPYNDHYREISLFTFLSDDQIKALGFPEGVSRRDRSLKYEDYLRKEVFMPAYNGIWPTSAFQESAKKINAEQENVATINDYFGVIPVGDSISENNQDSFGRYMRYLAENISSKDTPSIIEVFLAAAATNIITRERVHLLKFYDIEKAFLKNGRLTNAGFAEGSRVRLDTDSRTKNLSFEQDNIRNVFLISQRANCDLNSLVFSDDVGTIPLIKWTHSGNDCSLDLKINEKGTYSLNCKGYDLNDGLPTEIPKISEEKKAIYGMALEGYIKYWHVRDPDEDNIPWGALTDREFKERIGDVPSVFRVETFPRGNEPSNGLTNPNMKIEMGRYGLEYDKIFDFLEKVASENVLEHVRQNVLKLPTIEKAESVGNTNGSLISHEKITYLNPYAEEKIKQGQADDFTKDYVMVVCTDKYNNAVILEKNDGEKKLALATVKYGENKQREILEPREYNPFEKIVDELNVKYLGHVSVNHHFAKIFESKKSEDPSLKID